MISNRIPFYLIGVVAGAIAFATISSGGSAIYGSLWFKLLWAVVAASGCVVMWKRQLWRRPVIFLLHVSLLVILAGALTTSLTGKRGMLHLRTGIPTDRFLCSSNNELEKLPSLVRLDSFEILYYPGTEAPRDYVSHLSSGGNSLTINMNHPANLHGFRLYQTSFDEDLQGTILSVNYDPWGTGITYAGYLLFLVSFLASLWKPTLRRKAAAIMLLLACLPAKSAELPTISRPQADSLERVQVMWNSRPCPIGTMSRAFLQKVYGKKTYHGLTATQVLASWTLAPNEWNNEPIIKEKPRSFLRMNDFIDYSTPTPTLRNVGQNAKIDEKVALVIMLQNGTFAKPLPANVEPLSETRVTLELLYCRIPWLLIGIAISIVAMMFSLLRLRKTTVALRAVLTLYLFSHFVMLWYLGGHIPLGNTYETLLFVALCLAPFMTIGTTVTLAVALLIERNPQITPLVPVLNSPWLSAHVSCVMLSYALLLASMFRRRLLRPAVSLLAVGIFLGSVWANQSWGAYWSWDPKESWALITLLVYSIPLHTEVLPWFRSERNYRIYSLLAIATLLMTYFGVNYLLGGMHSYG